MESLKNLVQQIIDEKIISSRYQIEKIFIEDNNLYVIIDIKGTVNKEILEKYSNEIKIALEKEKDHYSLDKINVALTQSVPHIQKSKQKPPVKTKIPHTKKTIMVCSGKGGVGKSSISANIAIYLHKAGYKVGLLDADIYGPSIQTIFGISEQRPVIKDNLFVPYNKCGINLMSIGFMVNPDEALVWRGPMITKMLYQLMMQTDWRMTKLSFIKSDLDFLIIDTPPGTGDIHLSLAENYIIDGAIVVSTPQQLALSNAHRSVDMLRKLNIKIIGMIENMSYLISTDSNEKNHIFGSGKIQKYVKEQSIPLLGSIPIVQEISAAFDNGQADGWQTGKTTSVKEADESFKNICNLIVKMTS